MAEITTPTIIGYRFSRGASAAIPLLTTKLYVPLVQPGPGPGPRPRLIERLNAGLDLGCKLALVSAPAGFGKTALLSEWLAQKAALGASQSPPIEVLFTMLVNEIAAISNDFVLVLGDYQIITTPSIHNVRGSLCGNKTSSRAKNPAPASQSLVRAEQVPDRGRGPCADDGSLLRSRRTARLSSTC